MPIDRIYRPIAFYSRLFTLTRPGGFNVCQDHMVDGLDLTDAGRGLAQEFHVESINLTPPSAQAVSHFSKTA